MTNNTDQDALYQVLRHGRCNGFHCNGKEIAEEERTCPYAEEINNDFSLCNCCDICTYECTMDI